MTTYALRAAAVKIRKDPCTHAHAQVLFAHARGTRVKKHAHTCLRLVCMHVCTVMTIHKQTHSRKNHMGSSTANEHL